MREEAFGISITEYLKSGIIPIVLAGGGCAEIVDDKDLTYESVDEGAEVLCGLLTDENLLARKRESCRSRPSQFTAQMYGRRQTEVLTEILEEFRRG